MFPSMVDGLLPVQRRILLTLHTIARGSFVKTSKVVGENMARFHPHSPAEGTCAWAVQNGFADGEGSWGTDIGKNEIPPASMRYTKIKSSTVFEEIALKYIKSVKFEESEVDPEPKNFPTMVPLCFIAKKYFSYIGSGFRTDIPCYEISDVIKRLKYLLNLEKVEPIISPRFKNCKVTSKKKELKSLLNTGMGTIELEGLYSENEEKKCVYIHGWPPDIKFEALYNRINRYNDIYFFDNGLVGCIDESTKKNGTKIRLEVLKSRNTADIYNNLLDAVKSSLTGKITFRINVVDPDDNMRIATVDEMLLTAYENYKKYFTIHHENLVKYYENIVDEYDLINKIKAHLSADVLNKKYDVVIKFLSDKTGVSTKDIENVLEKYKIKKLMTVNYDKKEMLDRIATVKKILKNKESVIISEYDEILKKV